jgi:hypothetical protein
MEPVAELAVEPGLVVDRDPMYVQQAVGPEPGPAEPEPEREQGLELGLELGLEPVVDIGPVAGTGPAELVQGPDPELGLVYTAKL